MVLKFEAKCSNYLYEIKTAVIYSLKKLITKFSKK